MTVAPVHSVAEQAQSLANYMPGGKVWSAKAIAGTVIRGILDGLGVELWRTESVIETFVQEIIPDETQAYLDEWESMLGIPDDVFKNPRTDAIRLRDINIKLAALGIQTAEDFVELALDRFGITVTVTGGNATPGDFGSAKEATHTIVVEYINPEPNYFPLDFPIVFGSTDLGIMRLLFEKVKPATCNILFRSLS